MGVYRWQDPKQVYDTKGDTKATEKAGSTPPTAAPPLPFQQ
jgi:hypothetical protein